MALRTNGDETEAPPEGNSLPWEVPEIAAVAVLIAFAVIVVGGLAAGIYVSATQQVQILDQTENIWNAVQFGASWADPLLAVALLGVMGLCWWQVEAWTEQTEEVGPEDFTALGHIQRGRRISTWALGGLILVTAGAVAELAAQIGFDIPAHSVVWSRVIGTGADTIANVVILVAGIVVVNRVDRADIET
jgi:hypothetical protein